MHKWLIFFILTFASLVAVLLVGLRVVYTGRFTFAFLVWNLFLAWLPLLFAWLAYRWQQRPFPAITLGFLWFLFFPNAPYLLTDLIHLRPLPQIPLWYDLIMLFSYALLGLFLGFISLYLMQAVVSRRFGGLIGWAFVLVTLGLSGLGVYIGRFLRWNSWDIFVYPQALLCDVWLHLLEPRTAVVSALLASMLLFVYLLLWLLPHLAAELRPYPGSPTHNPTFRYNPHES